MPRALTLDEWADALRTFKRSAFRLELQPSYVEVGDSVQRFAAGDPVDPDDVPEFVAWADQIRALTATGRTVERVRVHDEPPTTYQRWERWAARQTVAAGEVIRYLPRSQAFDVGLLPDAGPDDWWLLDDERLVVMRFEGGRMAEMTIDDDPTRVAEACAWRGLAVQHATPDVAGATSP